MNFFVDYRVNFGMNFLYQEIFILFSSAVDDTKKNPPKKSCLMLYFCSCLNLEKSKFGSYDTWPKLIKIFFQKYSYESSKTTYITVY